MTDSLPLETSVEEVNRLLVETHPLRLVDCREPEEYELAAIASAQLIPMGELPERIGELEDARHARLVVYCHHGMRSRRVASWLRSQGFAQAQSMAGGIDRWSLEVDPQVPRYD
jgi:rhodanese-related sulfurtransferase